MSWEVQLAKLFRERDNRNSLGAIIGTVLEVDEEDGITDLKVGLLDNNFILETFWSLKKTFKKDEKLLFVTSGDNQQFYCIGVIEKVGVTDVSDNE